MTITNLASTKFLKLQGQNWYKRGWSSFIIGESKTSIVQRHKSDNFPTRNFQILKQFITLRCKTSKININYKSIFISISEIYLQNYLAITSQRLCSFYSKLIKAFFFFQPGICSDRSTWLTLLNVNLSWKKQI